MTAATVALFHRIKVSDAQPLFPKERVGEPETGCATCDPAEPDKLMNWMSASPMNDFPDVRCRVEAYCQSLVDTGAACWWINDAGHTELHVNSGGSYLFGELGIARIR
ncbi:hypothetical protein SAMN02787142_3043 [Burkholderia sp. WP9]|uniref:hypothetical protein n=1 Tax=Burkholderia sp. WP9 TaxID=1500263 RepID=UPI000896C318|nr:hypothetical protein [Burkholderia sp. WP9]SED36490.1 hypothetical protein SAMN02787142_3043 [Burkholderia sp. WP9]